jgi:hypothetical protein
MRTAHNTDAKARTPRGFGTKEWAQPANGYEFYEVEMGDGKTLPTIDIRGLNDLESVRQWLTLVNLIIAVDRNDPTNCSIVFGNQMLRNCVSMNKPVTAACVGIAIDFATPELELLLGLVQSVKGYDEYEPAKAA